ncbi:MAG: hypothetical protein AUJ92_01300 [Armatimonadetes bacterium CG2_30_59_28]|nr:MAG: hypothetical protein AUJ92_01300 [Armatimonadetes bacterium CG2_30_59_28]PIU64389.1 MAG: hypothetical protein COS85_12655 [Armatimonadetes bacterium CG07_land_8_20_14_0_80_59_28]PIY43726.1 MAG: hypothetical protein COZ05_10190 [Armatimonadetes bacterium CG_4_10_14_3_um_filter_59_10]
MAMAYPEAVCLAKQMAEVLVGKEIAWSPSLLYHGFGIRGYEYRSTEYRRGGILGIHETKYAFAG